MKNTMKTMIFGFLALVFALTVTSCGGDESEDPKPQKTDLELTIEAFDGSVLDFQSAFVDGVTVTDGCTTGTYKNSVQDITLTYNSDGTLIYDDNCTNTTYDTFTWEVKSNGGDSYTVTVKSGTTVVIKSTFNKSDVLDSNNNLKSTIDLVFDQINSPLNWELSPKMKFSVM